MWSKNCANACVKTAMTHGSSTIRSRPCPPASMNWPCINPLPSSTTCTITAPAASTEYFTGTERPAFPAKAATIFPASCTPVGGKTPRTHPWPPPSCIKRAAWEPGAAFPPTLPSAGASRNFSSKPEYRRIKSGLFHISSGKIPPLPPARPAGTSFTPDA